MKYRIEVECQESGFVYSKDVDLPFQPSKGDVLDFSAPEVGDCILTVRRLWWAECDNKISAMMKMELFHAKKYSEEKIVDVMSGMFESGWEVECAPKHLVEKARARAARA